MPVNFGSFCERVEEINQRRRRARSVSIVSTSELLKSNGCEGEEYDSVKKAVQEIVMVVIEKRKKQMVVIEKREEREELPGSPSFRIYCTKVAATREPDDDQSKVIEEIKKEKFAQEKERIQAREGKGREPTHERENSSESLISEEDSVGKPQKKKEKGGRLLALTKASSRVYSFLSVKNCYSPCSATGTAPDDCPCPHHHSANSA